MSGDADSGAKSPAAARGRRRRSDRRDTPPLEIDIVLDESPEEPPAGHDASTVEGPPPASIPPPFATFGRYELLGRLATGGMAEIYLAREGGDGGASRLLVVKLVKSDLVEDPDFVSMFMEEAKTALPLSHPNICHVYEFGRTRGRYFIAMEWVNGVTLRQLWKRVGSHGDHIPIPIVAKMIALVAESLGYAHRARNENGESLDLVHRDVSPHNVMASYDGVVKLLDFGIAKTKLKASLTGTGTLRGKFAYMSPEQAKGRAIDGRSDIFSLGICLYELLAGRQLYHHPTQYETLKAIVEGPEPSPQKIRPEVPDALEAVVQRALAKNVADRYQTAEEMQHDLEVFLAESREVVGSTRIGTFMHGLYADQIAEGPKLDRGAELQQKLHASLAPEAPEPALPAEDAVPAVVPARAPRSRRRLWILAAVMLLAIGGGVALALRAPGPPTAAVANEPGRAAPPDVAAAAETSEPGADEAPLGTDPAGSTDEPGEASESDATVTDLAASPDIAPTPAAESDEAAPAEAVTMAAGTRPSRRARRARRARRRAAMMRMSSTGFVRDPGL